MMPLQAQELSDSHSAGDDAPLSFGQLYYGVNLSQAHIDIEPIEGITPATEQNVLFSKVSIGSFYANGHVDSYLVIPFRSRVDFGEVQGKFSPGIEGGYNFYLRPLGQTRQSPFVGIGLSFPNYQFFTPHGKGVKKYDIALPVYAGYGFFNQAGQFDVGVRYAYGQDDDYYFSADQQGYFNAQHPEFFVNYKYISKSKLTEVGDNVRKNDKAWRGFFGAGLSSNWFTQGHDVGTDNDISSSGYGEPITEYMLGTIYSYTENKRLILQYTQRPTDITLESYGKKTRYQMDSRSVELLWNMTRWSGMAPYVGFGVNRNKMQFTDQQQEKYSGTEQQNALLLGWDVLPDPNAHFNVRFSLRYMKQAILKDEASNQTIKFPNLEVSYVNAIWQF